MRRLVFIDDDPKELDAFRYIVEGEYDYTTVHWPSESAKLTIDPAPDIFVSDLYLPSSAGDKTPTTAERDEAARRAKKVADSFAGLYGNAALDDKARLQDTMKAITAAYDVLRLQWIALGQSPDHGIAVLAKMKSYYPDVPFVFYSRKITPEDVIQVLEAGAVDAIRKGALKPEREAVLDRLARALEVWQRENARGLRRRGLTANITVFPRGNSD